MTAVQEARGVAIFVKHMRELAQVFQRVNIQNPYAGVHVELDSEGNSSQATMIVDSTVVSWHANMFLQGKFVEPIQTAPLTQKSFDDMTRRRLQQQIGSGLSVNAQR